MGVKLDIPKEVDFRKGFLLTFLLTTGWKTGMKEKVDIRKNMKSSLLWHITPCRPLKVNRLL
jgi:hypothetical protein